MSNHQEVAIVPDGDVTFICYRCDETPVRIHVASVVVIHASPVMKAMLAPTFQEGKTLSATKRVEIPLPYDDPDATVIFFNVIHMRTSALPRNPSLDELYELGIMTDKYGASEALAPMSHYWLSTFVAKTMDQTLLRKALTASYYFRRTELFRTFGVKLLLESSAICKDERSEISHIFVPLENERLRTAFRLSRCVDVALASDWDIPKTCTDCRGPAEFGGNLRHAFVLMKLLPLFKDEKSRSIADALASIRRVSALPSAHAPFCPNAYSGRKLTTASDVSTYFAKQAEAIECGIRKLCLACAREGNDDVFLKETCRHPDEQHPFGLQKTPVP